MDPVVVLLSKQIYHTLAQVSGVVRGMKKKTLKNIKFKEWSNILAYVFGKKCQKIGPVV